jgi:hypothetical protein
MKRLAFSFVLGWLGAGLLVTSMAVAAPNPPAVISTDAPLFDDPITDTVDPITPVFHPVASAMSEFFDVEYDEISSLHEDGLGFGVIARAYFVSQKLDDGTTPQSLLDEFESGLGWGEIMKAHELHPGLVGRGGNVGDIVANRDRNRYETNTSWGEPPHVPPGHLKKQEGMSPDDLFAGDAADDGRGNGNGPPSTPPGHLKDKDKGKKK